MLIDAQYDQEVFVNSLVKAAQKMSRMDIKPESMTIPQTTFNHFKSTLHYQQMFDNQEDWKKILWNSKHNPMNFDTPMFMGTRIKIIPDKESPDGICYMHSDPKFGDLKIPFEYSLKLVRIHKIKNNKITILVKSRADNFRGVLKNERCALDTLREMITETDFRKYLKYGFILVKGRSGCIYQVFREVFSHTKVWKNGRVIKEVCVRIEDKNIPPTDNVIALKIIIETSEKEFEKLGNVYKMGEAA
jgi:hypothetical protein